MQSDWSARKGRGLGWLAPDGPGAPRLHTTAGVSTGSRRRKAGVSLIELLCVMVIICILASLLLPTVSRVYLRIRGQAEEVEAEAIADLLREETRNYCASHPLYHFESKADFVKKCQFHPKCLDWVQSPHTEFVPFNYLFPTNEIVLTFHYGRKQASAWPFTKGTLTIMPEAR